MHNGKPPTSARVVALNDDGSVRSNGVTPLGECGKKKPLDFESSNGVRLVDVFDSLHAAVRCTRERLDVADLSGDDFFQAFDALLDMYECLVHLNAWIEVKRRR